MDEKKGTSSKVVCVNRMKLGRMSEDEHPLNNDRIDERQKDTVVNDSDDGDPEEDGICIVRVPMEGSRVPAVEAAPETPPRFNLRSAGK